MGVGEFGRIGEDTVQEIVIASPGGARASIVTIGAALRDLAVPLVGGGTRHVALGFDDAAGYADNPGHVGVMVGRCANRIAGGRFHLDGRTYDLPINDSGRNTLHGGPQGFTRRIWRLEEATETSVTLSLVSPDGDQGFPGRVDLTCRYALSEAATLSITVTATCDAPTPVNLANHGYFTLSEGADCRDHLLRIAADHYTPADDHLIPTGAVLPVADTAFDFRRARPIGGDYDVNFVLDGAPGETVRAAEATAPDGRLRLEVDTDQPGIQLYTAQHLGPSGAASNGLAHRAHAGFCLETQGFPDAPNKRHFPSVILRPGEVLRTTTTYRFVPL